MGVRMLPARVGIKQAITLLNNWKRLGRPPGMRADVGVLVSALPAPDLPCLLLPISAPSATGPTMSGTRLSNHPFDGE